MNDLFSPRHPFTARWIWGPHDPAARNLLRQFHTAVTVDDPIGCRLHVAADTRYRLWINGVWVGRGSRQSMSWLTFHDTWACNDLLHTGVNHLAVEVYHLGTIHQARPGLLVELLDGTGRVRCASGREVWQTRPDPAWNHAGAEFGMNQRGRFQELFDGRRETVDWQQGAGAGWLPAECLGGCLPWTLVVPRCSPAPVEAELPPPAVVQIEECQALDRQHAHDQSVRLSQAGRPVERALVAGVERLAQGGEARLACAYPHDRDDTAGIHDPCLLFDAGRVVTAFVELEVTAPEGAQISLGFAERLVDGRFNNALECWFASGWICRAGRQTIRFPDWRAFRFLRLRLGCCPEALIVHALRVVGIGPDLGEAAPFSCGDAELERIREISLASLRLCSVDGIYDTPHREGAQWLGDVALVSVPILQQVFLATDRVGTWLRQSHAGRTPSGFLSNLSNIASPDLACQNQIPDYSLWWLWALREQYQTTGDRRWIDHCWPGCLGLLAAHRNLVGADGLVHDVPGWVFIDWAPVERGRCCAAYNAILALALEALVELAAVRGDVTAGEGAAALLAGLRAGFAPTFWDAARGCITDGPGSTSVSEHANAAAILAGLLAPQQVEQAVRSVFAERSVAAVEAEPFFMAVVLPALRAAGHTALAVDLLRHRYRRMLAQGATSVLEEWGENGSWRGGSFAGFQRTHSHAWSGCPATALIALLAGIEPLAPGGARVRVSPWKAPFPYRIGRRFAAGTVTVAWDGAQVQVTSAPGQEVEEVACSVANGVIDRKIGNRLRSERNEKRN